MKTPDQTPAARPKVEAILPLGPSQGGMLYYSLFEPEDAPFLEQLRLTLEGDLDTSALRSAWKWVVDRHQALRSQFAWEHRETPLQVVRGEVELPWTEHDWRDLDPETAETRLAELLRDDRDTGLELDVAPLTRWVVVRRAEGRWEVLWTFHHLLLDGWSMALVLAEMWDAYRALVAGRQPESAPAPTLRPWAGHLARRDEAADREFWSRALEGLDEPFETPLPAGRELAPGEDDEGEVSRLLSAAEVETLTTFTRAQGLTLNALAAGAWALLLARYSGRSRVAFGTITSGRPPELPGIEETVGVFMHLLPSQVAIPDDAPVAAWLAGLQADLVEIREHGYRSLEEIQDWAGLPVRERPFDSTMVFENYPSDPNVVTDLPGLDLLDLQLRERGPFPLALYLSPVGDDLRVWIDYRRDHLDDPAARRLLGHYLTLLAALAEDPDRRLGDLPLLAADERERLVDDWAEGDPLDPAAGERPVHALFAERVAADPGAIAVVDGDREVSYRTLAAWAGAVTGRLRSAGVGPEDRVVLVADRSAEMLAGMLGILGAGAAYVPLEATTPAERMALVIEDSGARAVVALEDAELPAAASRLPAVLLGGLDGDGDGDDGTIPEPAVELSDSLAYVIYTSGSTGRPKGVLVSHRNLASYTAVAAAHQGVAPGVRVLQFASLGFDTSAEEIWPTLTRGATLVLRDDRALGGPAELAGALAEWRPEVLDLPTAFWHQLAAMMAAGDLELPASVRLVIIGGEKALGERVADWTAGLGDRRSREVRLSNTYGPTETTIVAVATEVEAPASSGPAADPPIGRPIPGARAYVVGPDLELLPPGVPGELLLGGSGVARGYLGRPALTAERFVPDPFAAADRAGGRLYRTGDLTAFGEDGALAFRGRIDGQLKIRGYRVEPGEVESVLAAHPALRDVAVVPWSPEVDGVGDGGDGGDVRLVAYVVAAAGEELPSQAKLEAFVGERLPDYMVPAAVMGLHELPRTASGKLDRKRLPAPTEGLLGGADFVPPRSPVEELLAGWWGEMLGLDRVSRDADFFRLGGHSLLVGRLAARVRKELGVDLPMRRVFEHPVLSDLAAWLDSPEAGADGPERQTLPPLVPTDRSGPLPLSYQQERVWFLDNMVPDTTAYNFQIRFWMRGLLDVEILERSLSEIVRRQEVFRTTFPQVDGSPVQIVHETWRVELPVTDLSPLGKEAAEARAEEILAEEVRQPFDVTALPLLRWRLLKIADDLHQLVQIEHHFVHDGWSVSVMLTELKAIYAAYVRGEESPLDDLSIAYGDFAVWQRSWMRGEAMDRIAGYWRDKLDGAPTRLDLPADHPRPSRMTLKGDAIREYLPTEVYRGLRSFGRREGFTLYMTMMAAFQAVVHRYTGMDDFLIGTGIANRRTAELETIIGMMVNSLVIRGELGGAPTFRQLLERVRATTLEAYAHQDMPFERLVEEIRPERDASRNPLFQVMFSFHDAAVPDLDFAGLAMGYLVEHNKTAKTDLNVIVAPRAEQRVGKIAHARDDLAMVTWEYSTDLFDRDRIERLIRHYYTLVAHALEHPDTPVSELPLMPDEERLLVTRTWTGLPPAETLLEEPLWETGLWQAFARQAAASPERVAVRAAGVDLTYGELAARAARLAHRLGAVEVGRATPVALALERSADLVTTLLGVAAAGGFSVPLDLAYPAERLAFMLEDSAAEVLITDRASAEKVNGLDARTLLCLDDPAEVDALAAAPAEPPPGVAGPDDAAYLVYTSGSTGRPKGVVVPQRAVARLVLGSDFADLGPERTFLQLAPVSFDAATLEIWAPLLNGGRLVVFPPEPPTEATLAETLATEGVDSLWLTAGLFHQMVDHAPESFASLVQVLAGGDVLSPSHCRRLLEAHPHLTLINGYGPTENTTFTACHRMGSAADAADAAEPVPIGRPVSGTRVRVVDPHLRPVPVGIPGELVAGGAGLARGYHGRPAATAESFVPDPQAPEPGARLYRTGDLAAWTASGELSFLGRLDDQVKIRGFRIEPGEVEAALISLDEVADARVLVVEPAGERAERAERALAAFVVAAPGATVDGAALRARLGERLPRHMVPATFTVLPELPLTANGKVDRRALVAALETGGEPARAGHVEPRTPLEAILVAIWTELLPVERVGVLDDFFELGGHSLVATRIVARVQSQTGVALPLAALFEEPTVDALARLLEADGVDPQAPTAGIGTGTGTGTGIGEDTRTDEDLSDAELDALLGSMMTTEGEG